MNNATQGLGPKALLARPAAAAGILAAIATAGAVSWATPDGNLVVTLVPAVVLGLAVFGLVRWRSRSGTAK